MKLKRLLAVALTVFTVSCAMQPPEPPVAPNFSFNPPTTTSPTRNAMSIAILSPNSSEAFLNSSSLTSKFLSSAQVDLEKVIVAKGFTTAGSFENYDEMTFSQKERSSLILRSTINFNVALQGNGFGRAMTATATGAVVLELLEPLSKEKVWIKHFELPAITKPVNTDLAIDSEGHLIREPDGTLKRLISQNSAVALLNEFYAAAFSRIWDQVDSREITSLRSDAQKLKGKSNYRAN